MVHKTDEPDSSDSDYENEHIWQEVDLHTNLEDGFGDFKTPGLCTFKRGDVSKGRYQYKGIYHKTSLQYVPGRGISKYHPALKNLIPIRKQNKEKERLGVDEASLLSFVTFSWLSRFVYKAYRKGLSLDDIPDGSPLDSCDYNSQRLEKLWNDEVSVKGQRDASFGKVVWRFIRTRVLLSCLVFSLNLITGFISVTVCMRSLIKFAEVPEAPLSEGFKWAALLSITELLRTVLYSTTWAISYRTAARLRSACLTLLFKKVIRLNSLGDNSIGGLINLFANDSMRIFDMVLFGPMILGGPITMLFGIIYILWLLGPWALLGMLIFSVFYPIQYGMSRWVGHFRAKTMAVGDKRIRLISEILSCIKLIKMYAWEKFFSKDLMEIRNKEMKLLHITAYCQSLTMSLATTVPIISAIVTFLSHIAAGNNLIASEAFTVKTYCIKMLDPLLIFSGEGWKTVFDSFVSVERLQTFPLISLVTVHYRVSMNNLRYGTENILDGRVSCNRLKKVLLLNEISHYVRYPVDRTQAVCISNGSFTYGLPLPEEIKSKAKKTQKKKVKDKLDIENINGCQEGEEKIKLKNNLDGPILYSIDFNATKGSLVGICGQVGSGKTSLLQACLGQLKVISGNVYRQGSCAFVSQQAWILNSTLKDNVLFGEPFDKKNYYRAISCCSLNNDINELPGGDDTEIGERGINISGGQKQRVSLARALYADRDIYFLDDPLSAVDANVGAHIFNEYILKALKDKTVIFVTHQIQFLNKCDIIYVMKEGRIVEKGTHSQLISIENGEYASMVNTWEQSQNDTEMASNEGVNDVEQIANGSQIDQRYSSVHSQDETQGIKDERCDSPVKMQITNGNTCEPSGVLTKKEHIETGSLHVDTYFTYMAAAGGLLVSLGIVLIMLLNVGTIAFSSWWLAYWIKAGSGGTCITVNNVSVISANIADNPDFEMYKTVYASTIVIIVISNFIRGFLVTKVTLRATKRLHNDLFRKVMYSPMYFFEETPIGRIQNLFSKDVDEVDARLPVILESTLQDGWTLIFAILFICLVFQWFIIPLIFLSVIYYGVSKVFRVAVRDLKRFDNATRSPIFSLVAETVYGLDTIHAFGKENDFLRKFSKLFDQNTTCLYICCIAMRWLSLRIDTLSVMITSITAVLVTIFHGQVSPALAGLAIAYSSTISGIFQYTIRLICEAETKFISVEHINTYLQTLEKEGGHRKCAKPPDNWPNHGSIRFQNVCLQYRPGLPLVLKNISFRINAGEKIGIVGRTGSGKSSLTVALFRLVELCNGSIKIDNVDISTLDLELLRSQLSIIPQDPVLFTGTVRTNLDPFGNSNDAKLWEILEKTHLKERVKAGTAGLDTKVGFSGDSLSVGERQLLCLARALLRKSKILILDEATAAVDPETEAAVQETIRKEFQNCTVLTIAHRLATITSCDRIILMDHGQVAELDRPSVLLENPNSKFYQMMEAAKEASSGIVCK
ncbi:ATP-binding cassette sub-family C member 5-like isoform X2 [Lycorma delicatula]|uniref:ATP-binding cassette sub-family C member 5-like isoform X2 n=1 Tax=Lycorma delicatula TaxID=130591 RepID=UPI003F517536